MIVEQGNIIAVTKEQVWVETIRKSACQSCAARAGCGQAVLAKMMDENKQYKKNVLKIASNGQNYHVGDTIDVAIEENALLRTAAVTYGLPILFLFIFSAFSQWFNMPDLAVASIGIFGLIAGFFAVRIIVSRWDCETKYQPKLLVTE